MDEESKQNNNGTAEGETPIPVPEDASPAAGDVTPEKASGTTPLTSEKVLDIALGVAVIAGEALDKAAQRFSERAKELQEQAPGFWDTAEERGRPVREKLVSVLKGSEAVPAEGAAPSGTAGLADSLRNLGSTIGISVGGGSARLSAEEEIRDLEDRVRELEQVVVSGKTGLEPDIPEIAEAGEAASAAVAEAPPTENPSENPVEIPVEAVNTLSDPPAPSGTTTAESNSYAFGEDKHEDFLAASPYAVSETDDERAVEATAKAVDVESVPQGETGPAVSEETAPEPPAPSTSSGRGSRKKQRDFDPEATDENTPSPSPEA